MLQRLGQSSLGQSAWQSTNSRRRAHSGCRVHGLHAQQVLENLYGDRKEMQIQQSAPSVDSPLELLERYNMCCVNLCSYMLRTGGGGFSASCEMVRALIESQISPALVSCLE